MGLITVLVAEQADHRRGPRHQVSSRFYEIYPGAYCIKSHHDLQNQAGGWFWEIQCTQREDAIGDTSGTRWHVTHYPCRVLAINRGMKVGISGQ